MTASRLLDCVVLLFVEWMIPRFRHPEATTPHNLCGEFLRAVGCTIVGSSGVQATHEPGKMRRAVESNRGYQVVNPRPPFRNDSCGHARMSRIWVVINPARSHRSNKKEISHGRVSRQAR